MHLGLVGLGKMGGNMRERLRGAGHTVVGFDNNPDLRDADDLAAMVAALPAPKVVWVMVPSGDATDATINSLAELLARVTSSSTAATPAGPTTSGTRRCSPSAASASSTAVSAVASGVSSTATR